MFITKIIKSKKISCLLKLNITASTLYYAQAMNNESKYTQEKQNESENEFENELKSYSNTVKSVYKENSENGYNESVYSEDESNIDKKQNNFISIKRSREKVSEYERIKELKESLKPTTEYKKTNIYNDNDFLNYNNNFYESIDLDKYIEEINMHKNSDFLNYTYKNKKTNIYNDNDFFKGIGHNKNKKTNIYKISDFLYYTDKDKKTNINKFSDFSEGIELDENKEINKFKKIDKFKNNHKSKNNNILIFNGESKDICDLDEFIENLNNLNINNKKK